jgi:antitoxin (DNA-binding transcriptional repressor) of toxin-antitoxin stability system
MERAAAGEELLVTHRGRPRIRVAPAQPPLMAVA